MKESIPHIARHGALVAVDFIPFQLDHPITTAALRFVPYAKMKAEGYGYLLYLFEE